MGLLLRPRLYALITVLCNPTPDSSYKKRLLCSTGHCTSPQGELHAAELHVRVRH